MLALLQFRNETPIARKDPKQWKNFKAKYKLEINPGIDFLIDPQISATLARLQGQVRMLPCKIGVEIHPLENILLSRSCREKRKLLAAIRVFTEKDREEQALSSAKMLQVAVEDSNGKFTLSRETVLAVKNLEQSPGLNLEVSNALSACFIRVDQRSTDKLSPSKLHVNQQEALDDLTKTIDRGILVVDKFFDDSKPATLELITSMLRVGGSLLELQARLNLFKESIRFTRKCATTRQVVQEQGPDLLPASAEEAK